MRVEHFMTKNPVICEHNQPVREVATQMRDKNVGSVVLVRDGRLAGIVTDRQLALHTLCNGASAESPVEEVMTADPARIHADENIFQVIDTFRSAGVVRRIPVVNEQDEVLGVVSVSDVAVIARRLLDGVLLEETHHALNEAQLLTGGKEITKRLRRPSRADRMPEQGARPHRTRPGPGARPRPAGPDHSAEGTASG